MASSTTTIKVVSIGPHSDTKVRIMMEMIVDVHRLAEVGSDLLHAAVTQAKSEKRTKKKN